MESGLPNKFWNEAILTTVYIRNRYPTSALDNNKIPYEAWFGVKPDLSHLKPFGYAVFALLHKEQRGKDSSFNSVTHCCIMLGYVHQTTKIWCLWDMKKERIILSADVNFIENVFPYKRTTSTS